MRSIFTNYCRNPQQNVSFFHIFLSCFELASRIANGERSQRSAARKVASLNKLRQLKTTKNVRKKNAIWQRWAVSTIVLPKSALRKRSRCYWKTRSNVKGQHAANRTDKKVKKSEEKKRRKEKNHLLLRILPVISRYGSHLMIVIIFVTQNNF